LNILVFLLLSIFFFSFPIFLGIAVFISLLSIWHFFLWIWTIGNFLYRKSESNNIVELRYFQLSIIAISAYFVYIIAFFTLPNFQDALNESNIDLGTFLTLIQLISSVALLYEFYFVAKCLNAAEMEMGEEYLVLTDYIKDFFLIAFFIIGVWSIQNRINILASKN